METIWLETIDSTNKYAKERIDSIKNNTFISAIEQTNGKGRYDRKWISNKGDSLAFSYVTKTKKHLRNYGFLSIGFACIIGQYLEKIGIKNVSVKWPNDVYVNDKKICGILLEGDINKYVVVGVGINVNQTNFEGEYRVLPTSIKLETNCHYEIKTISNSIFKFVINKIKLPFFKQFIVKYMRNHNYLLNKIVSINDTKGKVTGITKNMHLQVDGSEINSGEVTILENIIHD